ncbi:MAG TPA: ATP-binding cassette domain-containing protein [Micropepsaceae bacterium]|jgi:osmoprotectant transport system ATP-binding protein
MPFRQKLVSWLVLVAVLENRASQGAMMETGVCAIAIEDVWKSFDGGSSFAVRGVTLRIARQEFVALIGTSGSGKTTLLKLINRLVEPTRGTVAVDGKPVAAADPVRLRRGIGYVFQGVGLFPHMTVAENIAVTLRLLEWDKAAIEARVDEMLDLVRLPRDLGSRLPATLSGGQGQRVGVARALAAKPSIMLMDEPFGAVDPITRDALARDYRDLHETLGLTTLMVTHDVLEAVLLADRIAVMETGELVECGPTQELLANAKRPSVRALMAMPRRQAERIGALAANSAGP